MEDAADDIADGAEDAVDDIANGFDNYDDAHDYLLNQLGNSEEDGRYVVKNKSEETTEYQDGSEGYHFEVYDTKDDSGKNMETFMSIRIRVRFIRKTPIPKN